MVHHGAAAAVAGASATVVAGAAAHEVGVVLGAVAVVAPVVGAGVARAWRVAPRW